MEEIIEDRRYSIGEVSELVDVPTHVLRQWEERFTDLRPRRDRNDRRYYLADDIRLIRRIKKLHKYDGVSTEGVNKQLKLEKLGQRKLETDEEALELLDEIQEDIRRLLDLLDEEIEE